MPTYRTIQETGQDYEKEFTVQVEINGKIYGLGKGKNKKEAKKQAAINGLRNLN
ncbi:hypothetical protein H6F47_05595 [Sphaerospermopsis sp. FACHB-1094]|nr:hypothetical protein [Sphaerospermopsis sp. FACHB-1094]